jgi:hypothetical protein
MVGCILRQVKTPIDTHTSEKGDQHGRHRQEGQRGGDEAAKDKVSGDKKGKGTKDSESGVDKAERALKNRLK